MKEFVLWAFWKTSVGQLILIPTFKKLNLCSINEKYENKITTFHFDILKTTQETCSASWLWNCQISPLLNSYPKKVLFPDSFFAWAISEDLDDFFSCLWKSLLDNYQLPRFGLSLFPLNSLPVEILPTKDFFVLRRNQS